ncbi:MAG: DUF3365 domain-containing protein [Nitrospira sp. CR1.3]|nr:DUF3365 domain-containing protein [Nitrospira sp. CR1.3]
MRHGRLVAAFSLAGLLTLLGWTVTTAEPSFETTARYILEVVKAFRTAYVLQVVEHTRAGGMSPQEDWQKDAHFLPLPAQFVKAASEQVDSFEIGLIGLAPLNPANRPRTSAEADALIQLEKNRDRRFVSFVDGNQFKAVSADLALVQSCVDCHNQHPRSSRKNFQRWDVMGGLVVRLKRDVEPEGFSLPAEPSKRAPATLERMTPPPTTAPPWVR